VRGKFVLDRNAMAFVKPDAIIMHPLPRNEEISVEVDSDPRVAYICVWQFLMIFYRFNCVINYSHD